ncbi:DNA topology modulation protein [Paenibacillus radicis (ex Xue et al. 2023)]|uniref:DNA topology modulation protein n=1 Tax=Paenibacillus radicis (ex Xue et al. 2023) TaxID=2972489 RepID=A0ABT1YG44_9BACL|nr:DNA topology modulation protein [Paenibacillus radicis (ex Xue et al. 2023)]MCR8632164.1 DNA topology modulation protein [Paenibacillus radicis (ex Xue et al. 2023)]
MKKIMLIGSGGSGKSSLARQLGNILGIKVYHLDAIFWKPGWVGTPKEEQRKVQEELISRENWIIDGNYGGTIDIRLQSADTIIFIDLSKWLCLYRVLKRRIQYHKKNRIDMAEGCEERLDLQFLKWVWEYPEKQKPKILEKLHRLSQEKEIIILGSPKAARQFIEKMKSLKLTQN